MTVFFNGELLKPVLKVVFISLAGHRSCEVAAVLKVPILRARGRRGQVSPEPVLIGFTQKGLPFFMNGSGWGSCSLKMMADLSLTADEFCVQQGGF